LPKRTSFCFEAMEVRGKLAILDHNFHLHRGYKRHADGNVHLHQSFNEKSKRECARLVKENKTYPYVDPLIAMAMRFAMQGTPSQFVGAEYDPTMLAPTIRGAGFQSTSTAELLEKHVSRFSSSR
jgi:hypothetical protein